MRRRGRPPLLMERPKGIKPIPYDKRAFHARVWYRLSELATFADVTVRQLERILKEAEVPIIWVSSHMRGVRASDIKKRLPKFWELCMERIIMTRRADALAKKVLV